MKANRVLRNSNPAAAASQSKTRVPATIPFFPGIPSRDGVVQTAHDALEWIVEEVVAAVSFLSDGYWAAINHDTEDVIIRANGLISMAAGVSSQLETLFPEVCDEWSEAREPGIETAPAAATAHAAFELIVPQVLAAITLLSEAYWEAIDKDNEHATTRANGIVTIAYGVSCRLQTEFPLARDEWRKARGAAQPSSQRRAA